MRTIDTELLRKFDQARKIQTKALKERHKQSKRVRYKGAIGANIYTLYENGRPTDQTKEMVHLQAFIENKTLKERFIAHVNECLDEGVPTTQHVQQWKCTEHWKDREKKKEETL